MFSLEDKKNEDGSNDTSHCMFMLKNKESYPYIVPIYP